MKDLNTLTHYPPLEKLTDILCSKTQNANPAFFRLQIAYYFAKAAATMRCSINTIDRGEIPVNVYVVNMAPSGFGKTFSTNILEKDVFGEFRETFMESTFPAIAERNIQKLAVYRSAKKQTDFEEELETTQKEFDQAGNILFSFDSGTTPAFKQLRHKMIMAKAGSLNMEIDEIGSNLLGNSDILTTYLETYDIGLIKSKLVKNTTENKRGAEMFGSVPTNMLAFGVPAKLLNGGKIEDEFFSMLESGYARRCLFGYTFSNTEETKKTAKEVYASLIDKTNVTFIAAFATKMKALADAVNFHKKIIMSEDISILLIEYRLHCEEIALRLPEHEEVRKAELNHRYFKALKLAGAYAFIEGSYEITDDLLYNAIHLVEESGKAFNRILNRDKNFVRLAKYIASVEKEITHVDLTDALPFYKGPENAKKEMLTMAIAYGYKNNIVIKKQFTDGIEFFTGESLAITDLSQITISYSQQLSDNYKNETIPFKDMYKLTQTAGFHWVNHHLVEGNRREQSIIMGFNLVVLDVDGGVAMSTARLLLKDYEYLLYTTKSHTEAAHRFRIILPISHTLKFTKDDYSSFMENIYEWLPFEVDTSTKDRCRKWLSNDDKYEYNQGKLLDALLFIPKTSKLEERKQIINSQQSLNNIERWMLNEASTGNRNNTLSKYAFLLVDAGMDISEIQSRVTELNSKLPEPLSEQELMATIIMTASKKIIERAK